MYVCARVCALLAIVLFQNSKCGGEKPHTTVHSEKSVQTDYNGGFGKKPFCIFYLVTKTDR